MVNLWRNNSAAPIFSKLTRKFAAKRHEYGQRDFCHRLLDRP